VALGTGSVGKVSELHDGDELYQFTLRLRSSVEWIGALVRFKVCDLRVADIPPLANVNLIAPLGPPKLRSFEMRRMGSLHLHFGSNPSLAFSVKHCRGTLAC